MTDLTPQQKRDLITALLACPTLQTRHSRDDVAGHLPETIRHGIQRRDDARSDVTNILEHCLNYDGGLQNLLAVLNFYEGESLLFQEVQRLCAGPAMGNPSPPAQPTPQPAPATSDWAVSIVAVLGPDGKPCGAGFLAADRLVLTCAHVVAAALGLGSSPEAAPAAELRLAFPFAASQPTLPARIAAWDAAADLAGLELLAAQLAEARPARRVDAPDLWGHPFRSFGFPRGYDHGVWASGRILALTANGWLQIEDTKTTGYTVQPGFSGGPLWDDELGAVVGMVVAADSPQRTAYGLPAARLAAVLPADSSNMPVPPPPQSAAPWSAWCA